MVLIHEIGVRFPVGSQISRPECESVRAVVVCRSHGESKDGAGTQDERSEGLSASQGRERYIFIHENNRLLTDSLEPRANLLGAGLRGNRSCCQLDCSEAKQSSDNGYWLCNDRYSPWESNRRSDVRKNDERVRCVPRHHVDCERSETIYIGDRQDRFLTGTVHPVTIYHSSK